MEDRSAGDSPRSRDFRVDLLNELVESLNLGRSFEEVFELIYERLRDLVPYNRIAVALTDSACRKLTIVAARSDGEMVLGKGYSGSVSGSSLEPLLREGRSRIINDLEEYLARKPESESTRLIVREGMRASLTLPLRLQGKPVGVMFFSSRRAGVYTSGHEDVLRAIVGHMAIAIERTRLMDELREKSEYLESILQNSAEAIVVIDAQNRIRTWNEGARRIFGYAPEEIVGKDHGLLFPPETRHSAEESHLLKVLEERGYLQVEAAERVAKDGRRVRVSGTSTLLRDKKGRVLGRSSILRDVTEMKRLQEELIRAQSLAAVGELAATVAHEIKNPLAGVSGAVQVLRDTMPADDPRRDIVGEILEQIARLDRIVRDLLVFARPAVPLRQEVDLQGSLARAWAAAEPRGAAQGIRFSVEGAERVRVSADARLLEQVWINLFQNAVEAMPDGGELQVRVRPAQDRLRVEVQDSGSGVDPAHVRDVFRPFFTTKTRGTGLGLAISRKIVEAHGGTIDLESVPGRGTKVTVEIPR